MNLRNVGPFSIRPVALGGMSLSHAYSGKPDQDVAARLLNQAVDLGDMMIDTAPMYGRGHNETLVGEALKGRRHEYTLASKCGLWSGEDGKRIVDCRPETVLATLEDSLRRLQTEVIDLYYVHRTDPNVPIEDTIGALAGAVKSGKIRALGLSEMSADHLRRAQTVHPIAAMQTEYSLWTRNPEIAVLEACRETGVAFVAFSPVARGFLTDRTPDPTNFESFDIRRGMPRFQGDNWTANLRLLEPFGEIAREAGCTRAQLALAWVLARGRHIVALPGTGKPEHLAENAGAEAVALSPEILQKLDRIINQTTVHGRRYNAGTQMDVSTEEFAP